MNIMRISGTLIVLLIQFSCTKKEDLRVDVSGIPMEVRVARFEQRFYGSGTGELQQLKGDYPFLFPESNPDSVWLAKMQDEDEQFLYTETQKLYADFHDETEELRDLFRHIRYYYPKFEPPRVITVLSNVDYENRVILADSLLFLSLDAYLGADHEVYEDYPAYIKQNNTRDHLMTDVAGAYADRILLPNRGNTFVSNMVQAGKRLQLQRAFLPGEEPYRLMGYSPDQWDWASRSESHIWKYFIENEMVYSSDPDLTKRFLDPAPFSKFYLEVDRDSPGRIGAWFGWEIVRSFLQNNETTLQEMLATDNEEIFKRSRYKPKK